MEHINLKDVLALIKEGDEIILTEGDTPLARLLPIAPARIAGLNPGAIWTSEDFDAPLDESVLMGDE